MRKNKSSGREVLKIKRVVRVVVIRQVVLGTRRKV